MNIKDNEIEVEYQGDTIGKYNLGYDGKDFMLMPKQTNCLAPDNCGIPKEKLKAPLGYLSKKDTSCTPGGGCC